MRQGYIYYILDLTNADMYIGSCWKDNFSRRKRQHRDMITCSSKQIINNNDFIIEVFEENEFINREELRKREQYYIDNNKCINKLRAYTSDKMKKEQKKEYSKEYELSQKRKDYKKEYIRRPDRMKYSKEFYYKYKETEKGKQNIINKKNDRSLKVCCIKCKKEMTKGSLNRHIKNVHKT